MCPKRIPPILVKISVNHMRVRNCFQETCKLISLEHCEIPDFSEARLMKESPKFSNYFITWCNKPEANLIKR